MIPTAINAKPANTVDCVAAILVFVAASGLAVWMGEQLSWAGNASPYIILLTILTLMIFLTS